jgi:mannose-6-phosphate isomerase-like protein (cupin superfamily)
MSPDYKAAAYTFARLIFAGSVSLASAQQDAESQVVSAEEARNDKGDWGSITVYFEGETRGVRDNFAATAILNPGAEIHAPHEHAEEEYLLVTEGAGIWVLGEKSFPAKAGDMLYSAPWVYHGLRNGNEGPMKFVVWKFSAKGVPEPTPPPGEHK